jgi:ABC-type branched-subunit amino acid transport system substrate-binding protein
LRDAPSVGDATRAQLALGALGVTSNVSWSGSQLRGRGSMRRSLVVALTTVMVALGCTLVGAPAGAQAKSTDEIGVTKDAIKVAVIADVDNPVVPGVLQGIVDGAEGWGKYVNAKGGIAGRKVEVDFIDSKLDANATRNAIIQACSNDFALVGTGALLLQTVDDITSCKDSTGAATGIPDIAALITNQAEGCAPTSFTVTVPAVKCDTLDQKPQTYRTNNGDSQYLMKVHKNLHGPMVIAADSPNVVRTSKVLNEGAQAAGIKADDLVSVSGRAPESVYTPVIQKMKADNSNYALSSQAVTGVIAQRQEAQLQGLTDPNIVWMCTLACYHDDSFVKAGDAVNGQYMWLTFLPFEETAQNAMNANFIKYVGKDKANGFSSWGFTAGLLFEQAAKAVVAKDGKDGLTRANLLAELKNIHDFNAGGLVGTVDVGNKIPSSCIMLEQYKGNGKFARVWPSKKGTFDCKKSNLHTFQADLNGSA